MRLFFITRQARCQVVLYVTSHINMIVHISLPERSLAQEKSRERLSTRESYFLRKGLLHTFYIQVNLSMKADNIYQKMKSLPISPGSIVTFNELHTCSHSAGGINFHDFLPEICACQDGLSTESI